MALTECVLILVLEGRWVEDVSVVERIVPSSVRTWNWWGRAVRQVFVPVLLRDIEGFGVAPVRGVRLSEREGCHTPPPCNLHARLDPSAHIAMPLPYATLVAWVAPFVNEHVLHLYVVAPHLDGRHGFRAEFHEQLLGVNAIIILQLCQTRDALVICLPWLTCPVPDVLQCVVIEIGHGSHVQHDVFVLELLCFLRGLVLH
mmetsp:Transcript_94349/g.262547  ORF Transcript_94349/g.262547 Transcript_94349/m.262547 type:complete len:201 (-) Transcript_94349:207-809(-)